MIRKFVSCIAAVFLSAVSLAAQNPPSPVLQGTGKISGVITRGDNGKPVEGATVRLLRWEGGRGQAVPSVRTDAQGRFVYANLIAGSYDITAVAEGLVTQGFGQTVAPEPTRRIDIIDGQQFSEANIILPKTSAIEGQLTDEFGDPVPGVMVQLSQVMFVAGKTRMMPMGGPQNTLVSDDTGRYRVFGLAPGDYYVSALSGPFAGTEAAAGFGVTHFPGTASPADAKMIHLSAGQDMTTASFGLKPAKSSLMEGVAVDEMGKPISGASIMLVQTAGGDVRSMVSARVPTGPDGRFSFRNVPDGTYVLQGFGRPAPGGSNNLGAAPFGALPVTISEDRTDLRLQIREGAVMRGRILFDGDSSELKPSSAGVVPAPVEFITSPIIGGPPNQKVNDDWTFEVRNQSGLRSARVSVGSAAWYVKSITHAGKDITDLPIDFRSGDVNDVEIMMTKRIGTITGSVTGDQDAPVPDFTVVAFAEDPMKLAFPSRHIAVAKASPSQPGTYRITGLPAAAYLVAVVPALNANDAQNPEVLEALRPIATRVVVGEGDTKTVGLKIIKR